MFSRQDVSAYIADEDVRFVRLAFCDITGRQKILTVMPDELDRAFDDGISIDASAIEGFGDEASSELFIVPDPATLSIVPWHPLHGRMVRMYCDVMTSNGSRFPLDSRYILKRASDAAADAGISCKIGAEFEFYLFKTDESGERTDIPFDRAGYMDIDPGDKCEAVRREICLTLSDMGIKPEAAHHEEGPGQNEIDFKYGEPMTAADNATTFKSVVRTIAARNGLYASFYPKPLNGKPGNGFHINVSVQRDGSPSDTATASFMAGILSHISEITSFLNPVEQSYLRLGRMKAPKYISWSHENRSQLIRIPAQKGESRRIELRSPDPCANPYIAFALIIYSGLDGVKRGLAPPPPAAFNLYRATPSELAGLPMLPSSLGEALAVTRKSEFLRSVVPELLSL